MTAFILTVAVLMLTSGLVLFVIGAADLIRRTKDMEKIAGRGR